MKNILLTGATGFTGLNLAKRLDAMGFNIIAPVRKTSDTKELQALNNVTIVPGDISNKAFIDSLFEKNEIYAVFHIAAAFRTSNAKKSIYTDINYTSTKHLLENAVSHNIAKFIHCSTGGVCGHIKNPPGDENSPYSPGDIYQETKLKGELLVLKYFKEKNLSGSIIRPTAIYGPGDMRIYKFFKLVSKKYLPILGKGEVCYHMVYIDDLVESFVLCLTEEKADKEIFLIGGEHYLSLNELFDTIANIMNINLKKIHIPFMPIWILSALCEFICVPLGIKPPLFRRRTDLFRKNRAFSIAKAKNLLGYQPKTDLKTGLLKTYNWYKEQKLI